MKSKIVLFILAALSVCSCASVKQIAYFQDLQGQQTLSAPSKDKAIRFVADDKLSIVVNSKDPQLSNLFNLPYTTRTIGAPNDYASSYNQGILSYKIDSEGNIDFPVLGKLHIAGLTREEVAEKVKTELITRNYVKDPVVTVEYCNLMVNVMGEVNHPGRFPITNDRFSVLDAISAAGDLTIFGLRNNVKVVRYEGDVAKTYELDLCSGKNLMGSPVFYLQQNDLVYVEPNKMRARQATVNGNTVLSTSFWISVINMAMTVMLAFIVRR